MHFSLIVLLLCTVLVLSGCNKKVEVEEEVLEESALSVPYSIGPSSPPEVDFPTSNPPSNNE